MATGIRTAQQHIRGEIRAELGRQDMSQGELAQRLGWSAEVMSKRLRGDTEFRGSELSKIAEILGVPVARFFPPSAPTSS
jgi:transcriptional regulator with XRE-family HTH domain